MIAEAMIAERDGRRLWGRVVACSESVVPSPLGRAGSLERGRIGAGPSLGSMGSSPKVVLDTNIFVAAGFNPHSASARIVEEVRVGRLSLMWSDDTRRESRAVVEQIPPLSWDRFADLFGEAGHYAGRVNAESVDHVSDPDDRKFSALAGAVDAVLVTSDDDLLGTWERRDVLVLTPDELVGRR